MKEIWRDVLGYEGFYQVSNLGKVKSLKRKVKSKANSIQTKKGKFIKEQNNKGYLCVCLCTNGMKKTKTTHRLVAEAFIPNIYNEYTVNHIDENKHNNNANNLEWCSLKYNSQYSKNIQVVQFDKQNKLIKVWGSASEVERNLKINNSSIIQCCRNKRKTAGGFRWHYGDTNEIRMGQKRR